LRGGSKFYYHKLGQLRSQASFHNSFLSGGFPLICAIQLKCWSLLLQSFGLLLFGKTAEGFAVAPANALNYVFDV
jgi:hypothetical protein